jgi:hypothetical protein
MQKLPIRNSRVGLFRENRDLRSPVCSQQTVQEFDLAGNIVAVTNAARID